MPGKMDRGLVVLPLIILSLFLAAWLLPSGGFNTVVKQFWLLSCFAALFGSLLFPSVLPRLSASVRAGYALTCSASLLLVLRYFLLKSPPNGHEFDSGVDGLILLNMVADVIIWGVFGRFKRCLGTPLRSDTLWGVVAWIIALSVLCVILRPLFAQTRDKAPLVSCISNVKQLQLSVLQYTQDWDEKLPPASRWAGLTTPYLRADKESSQWHCTEASSHYSYAFNQAVGGLSPYSMEDAALTINLFESDTSNWNAVGGKANLPSSPRHHGGNIFGFLDGHVKWCNPTSAGALFWQPHMPPETKQPFTLGVR